MNHQVAITGFGVVTALGDVNSTCEAVSACDFLKFSSGQIREQPKSADEKWDPATRLAVAAADAAIEFAGLTRRMWAGRKGAVFFGSSRSTEWSREAVRCRIEAGTRPNGHECAQTMIAAPAVEVSRRYGVQGPAAVISSTCTSAAQSLWLGTQLIRTGTLDYVICGGVESCFTPIYLAQLESAGLLATTRSLPFDLSSQGMHVSTGAGVFVLERSEPVANHPMPVVGHLLGVSVQNEAFKNIGTPTHATITKSIRAALDDSHLVPDDIAFIVSHGCGIPRADAEESVSLRSVFGSCLPPKPVVSMKPFVGHTVGASAAVELGIALNAAIEGRSLPSELLIPELGEHQHSQCNMPYRAGNQAFLKLASGLGGISAAIIASSAKRHS